MMETQPPTSAFEPMGLLLEQYFAGNEDASLEVHLEDGDVDLLFGSDLYRTHGFAETDELALAMARGRVLDVGAAAGSHTLDLQVRGLDVTALDSNPTAVAMMRKRGVKRVFESDIFDLSSSAAKPEDDDRTGLCIGERFDTVLFLMNGLGVAGDLLGLGRLLDHCHQLVAAEGILLADVSDLALSPDPKEASRIHERRKAGRYAGEATLHMEISTDVGRVVGAPFPWLYVDPETLSELALANGWRAQVLFDDGEGDALLCLRRR